MNRVHDLSGDWFALPPVLDDDGESPWSLEWGNMPPAIGDVLASTRADGCWGGVVGHGARHELCEGRGFLWADPPFVRVVGVLPIHTTTSEGFEDVPSVEIQRDGSCRWFSQAWHDDPTDLGPGELVDLPGAQPGGWAVRVEPVTDYDGSTPLPMVIRTDDPPPTGRPLNEQTTTAEGAA